MDHNILAQVPRPFVNHSTSWWIEKCEGINNITDDSNPLHRI